MLTGTRFNLEVNPKIPQRLARLEELANNLWYSWDIMPTRALFSRLDPVLWNAVGHSPKALLKRIDQRRLTDAAEDKLFIDNYNRVLSAYDSYHGEQTRRDAAEAPLAQSELVAYFCAEFGFHESLPIYSGGLGILAGDHCKTASDMRLPFVGVGLLTGRDISPRPSTATAIKGLPTWIRISRICRLHRCSAKTVPN